MSNKIQLADKAKEVLAHFRKGKRMVHGIGMIDVLSADAPEWLPAWVGAFVHDSYSVLPCDWRYQFVVVCLNGLASEADSTESGPDLETWYPTTMDRRAWFLHAADSVGDCEVAREETGAAGSVDDLIAAGMAWRLARTHQQVLEMLADRIAIDAEPSPST